MAGPANALVVDASVAAKWHLVDEEESDKALALLERFANGAVALWAPDQIRYEVPSAITVATTGRNPRLQVTVGRQAIEKFLSLGLSTVNDTELIVAAYDLVHLHGCAMYDALYLALAERLGVPLITADRRLYNRVGHLTHVLWIGDYDPSPEPRPDDERA
jgi:predicted nucleic acid-binding protein